MVVIGPQRGSHRTVPSLAEYRRLAIVNECDPHLPVTGTDAHFRARSTTWGISQAVVRFSGGTGTSAAAHFCEFVAFGDTRAVDADVACRDIGTTERGETIMEEKRHWQPLQSFPSVSVLRNAADMPIKAPRMAVPSAYNWTGLYVGANGGWGQERRCAETFVGVAAGFLGCHNADGGFVGGQLGYRWQSTAWVFGLEAQGDWACFREE